MSYSYIRLGIPLLAAASSAILLSSNCEAHEEIGKVIEAESTFSIEKPTIILDAEEFGVIDTNPSVKMYSRAAYRANSPIEDRSIVKSYSNGDLFAGVFDGHGGWQVSNYLHRQLIESVRQRVNQNATTCDPLLGSQKNISEMLQDAFVQLDRDLAAQVQPAFNLGFGAVGRCGACALLVYIHDNVLSVANGELVPYTHQSNRTNTTAAGDTRCVLGSRKENGGTPALTAIALSNDHNAMSANEQEKLRREHPGEANVYKCRRSDSCYVKGALQPTR